jgi:hypothetical protein
MSWLQNTLKMRRVSLRERKLLREIVESHSPRYHPGFAGNLEETIKSSRNGTAQ